MNVHEYWMQVTRFNTLCFCGIGYTNGNKQHEYNNNKKKKRMN